jgi:phage host-nuclease inhibitor protein Gam
MIHWFRWADAGDDVQESENPAPEGTAESGKAHVPLKDRFTPWHSVSMVTDRKIGIDETLVHLKELEEDPENTDEDMAWIKDQRDKLREYIEKKYRPFDPGVIHAPFSKRNSDVYTLLEQGFDYDQIKDLFEDLKKRPDKDLDDARWIEDQLSILEGHSTAHGPSDPSFASEKATVDEMSTKGLSLDEIYKKIKDWELEASGKPLKMSWVDEQKAAFDELLPDIMSFDDEMEKSGDDFYSVVDKYNKVKSMAMSDGLVSRIDDELSSAFDYIVPPVDEIIDRTKSTYQAIEHYKKVLSNSSRFDLPLDIIRRLETYISRVENMVRFMELGVEKAFSDVSALGYVDKFVAELRRRIKSGDKEKYFTSTEAAENALAEADKLRESAVAIDKDRDSKLSEAEGDPDRINAINEEYYEQVADVERKIRDVLSGAGEFGQYVPESAEGLSGLPSVPSPSHERSYSEGLKKSLDEKEEELRSLTESFNSFMASDASASEKSEMEKEYASDKGRLNEEIESLVKGLDKDREKEDVRPDGEIEDIPEGVNLNPAQMRAYRDYFTRLYYPMQKRMYSINLAEWEKESQKEDASAGPKPEFDFSQNVDEAFRQWIGDSAGSIEFIGDDITYPSEAVERFEPDDSEISKAIDDSFNKVRDWEAGGGSRIGVEDFLRGMSKVSEAVGMEIDKGIMSVVDSISDPVKETFDRFNRDLSMHVKEYGFEQGRLLLSSGMRPEIIRALILKTAWGSKALQDFKTTVVGYLESAPKDILGKFLSDSVSSSYKEILDKNPGLVEELTNYLESIISDRTGEAGDMDKAMEDRFFDLLFESRRISVVLPRARSKGESAGNVDYITYSLIGGSWEMTTSSGEKESQEL